MDKQNCYRIVEFGKLFKSNYGNSDNCCILIHNATYFFSQTIFCWVNFLFNFFLNKRPVLSKRPGGKFKKKLINVLSLIRASWEEKCWKIIRISWTSIRETKVLHICKKDMAVGKFYTFRVCHITVLRS